MGGIIAPVFTGIPSFCRPEVEDGNFGGYLGGVSPHSSIVSSEGEGAGGRGGSLVSLCGIRRTQSTNDARSGYPLLRGKSVAYSFGCDLLSLILRSR